MRHLSEFYVSPCNTDSNCCVVLLGHKVFVTLLQESHSKNIPGEGWGTLRARRVQQQ